VASKGIVVVLCGVEASLVLDSTGPELTEADVDDFEHRLGHTLQVSYREFLLKYNGGKPASGEVLGRDDDPKTPYAHGDSVRVLFKLPTIEQKVATYERLQVPQEHAWEFPDDILPIGNDAFGNIFGMELGPRGCAVRFIDHERLDAPIEAHRVLADDFMDFTQRFKSLEDKHAEDSAKRARERHAIEHGSFPASLERQCSRVQESLPHVRTWIRAACLRVLTTKGFFALHSDEDSRTVLDCFAWLQWTCDGSALRDSRHATDLLMETWIAGGPDSLGINGISPAFVDGWWNDRMSRGHFEYVDGGLRLGNHAIKGLLTRLSALGSVPV
jgi:hypothetical protein